MMTRQAPRYDSLRSFLKDTQERHELFDIKEQFDEALWYAYLEELSGRGPVSGGRDRAFYQERMDSLRPLRGGTPLANFLQYKGLPKFCDFDCDGTVRKDYLRQGYYSWFPREIYRTLWNWQDLCRVRGVPFQYATIRQFAGSCYDDEIVMGPDTMNSFWITFSLYLISHYGDTYRWNNFRNTVFFREGENGRQRDRADRIRELVEADENYIASEPLRKFAGLTHTVGNLSLVPAGYNGYRGTQPCMKDYFDLSLENLLHVRDGKCYLGEDAGVRRKNFVRYVNAFFLWDYVDKRYETLPLCASHAAQMKAQRRTGKLEARGVLPCVEEIDGLCGAINEKIRRRGLFVVAMLRIALGIDPAGKDAGLCYVYEGARRDAWARWDVSGIYKKIMEEVFLRDTRYSGGYGEVADLIRSGTAGSRDGEFVEEVLDAAWNQIDGS